MSLRSFVPGTPNRLYKMFLAEHVMYKNVCTFTQLYVRERTGIAYRALAEPGKFLFGMTRSAHDAQEKLFQRELFAGCCGALPGAGCLRFNAHAKFLE